MAALGGTSSLTRTRSTRLPSNLGKAARDSRAGASGVSTTGTATSQPTASPTSVSHVSLFLTNLRLLDLDLRPDWPDINTLTFTTKDAAQGQKKRIQCVEWALYHLFSLWDSEEARNKLQPFFPPLDQVQSLNLRAALLRALEQAKKNGVLGRDAVVRKTMLDECKGERLEEVLAVFSSAVLKKMVAEQQLNEPDHPALAQTLALENRGYSGERGEITALVLAHKVSLRRMLDDRRAARARFNDFSNVLASKEKAIAKRREAAVAARRTSQDRDISDSQRLEVWRMVRDNWTGNERWLDTLLYGDSKARQDGLLSAQFDRVWRRVQSGRLAELEDEKSSGLLEQLDNRVRGQQERLEKWQGFRQRMFGNASSEPAKGQEPPSKARGIDLGFRAHENLHLGRMSPRKLPRTRSSQLDSHYEALISRLKTDLASADPGVPEIPAFFRRPPQEERSTRTAPYAEPEPEEISDISDLEEATVPSRPSPSRREPVRVLEEPAFEPVLRKAKTFDDDHLYPNDEHQHTTTPSRLRRSATVQSHSPSTRRRLAQESPTRTPERRRSPPPTPEPQPTPRQLARSPHGLVVNASPEPPPSPEQPPLSPTQQLADQILASVSAASPSPVKKPRRALSLAERTRLSIARRTSHANLRVPADEDADDHDDLCDGNGDDEQPDPLTIKRASAATMPLAVPPTPVAEDGDAAGGYEDLVSRTRRSMAGYEAARQKAQLERRRSLRRGGKPPAAAAAGAGNRGSGYFPAVSEEDDGNAANSTLLLAEELMTEDDYEAVFMSRPKIKTSPVGTPVRGFWD